MKLSNRQNDILRRLYPDAKLSENDFSTEFNIKISDKSVHELKSLKLICIDTSRLYSPALINLTEQGRAYVENLEPEPPKTKSEIFFKWLKDNALELVAIIISVIALLKP